MAEDLTPAIKSDVTSSEYSSLVDDDPTPLANDLTVISTEPLLAPLQLGQRQQPSELGRTLIGQQLGDIRLEEFVGGGGMGAVFRGTDTRLHRTVAVKVLVAPHGRATPIRMAALRSRPAAPPGSIIRISPASTMSARSAARAISSSSTSRAGTSRSGSGERSVSACRCAELHAADADALMHAWQRDVVHRDIKPSNILLTPDGQAKLVDMGLARLEQADATEHELHHQRRDARYVRLHVAGTGPRPARPTCAATSIRSAARSTSC